MRFAATNEHTMHGRRLVVILAVLCTVTLVAQDRRPRGAGRRPGRRVVCRAAVAGWQQLHPRRRPSTSWRCGRPRRSTPQPSTRSWAGPRTSGMNTMRVFLHDLLWEQDAAGFRARMDRFLVIAAKHHISRCSCCSTRAGTRTRGWARSARRRPASTTPAGCRARARAALKDPASIRGSRGTSRGSSARSAGTRASWGGTSGTSPTTRTASSYGDAGAVGQGGARAGVAAAGVRVGP